MAIIWFIRHAECEVNVGLPTSTPFAAQLTPLGMAQAYSIARAMNARPDLIVTSSYLRSKQTAAPTLQRFPSVRHEEWSIHEFTYLVHSLPKKETTLEERRVHVEKYWKRCDQYYKDGEGAESFVTFMQRVSSILKKLENAKEDFIVIFSHGQFMLAILAWLMGSIVDNMQHFRYFLLANEVPNGAILKVDMQKTDEIWFSPFFISHLPEERDSSKKTQAYLDPSPAILRDCPPAASVWRDVVCLDDEKC